LPEQIKADVDDYIADLVEDTQEKYNLSHKKARDYVNQAIADLCCSEWQKRKMYGCGKK